MRRWEEWRALLLMLAGLTARPARAQAAPDLVQIREATARYQDVRAALADGYIHDPTLMCVDAAMVGQPAQRGAMGLHLFQPRLAGIRLPPPAGRRLAGTDTILDWERPEVLVYEPQPDRSLELVAVEYLVFAAAWQAGHREVPRFGTEPFVYTADDPATQHDEGHMLEPHYELHLWVHRENPAGVFEQFNPRVSCGHYGPRAGERAPDVLSGILADGEAGATQISTEELRERVTRGGVLLLDARTAGAFAREHLPGALGVAPPDRTPSERAEAAVRAVARAVRMDRTRPVIVYGDGPASPEPRLAAAALQAAGYTAVRRYQLGLAVWQALGGVTAISGEGAAAAWTREPETLFFDAREPALQRRDSLPGLEPLPVPMAARAIAEGRLPRDRATPIITVGRDAAQARALAEQLVRQSYRRVAFVEGDWDAFRRLVTAPRPRMAPARAPSP